MGTYRQVGEAQALGLGSAVCGMVDVGSRWMIYGNAHGQRKGDGERRADELGHCFVGSGQQARQRGLRTHRVPRVEVVGLDPALSVVEWLLPPVLVTAATRRDGLDSSRRYSSSSALRMETSNDDEARFWSRMGIKNRSGACSFGAKVRGAGRVERFRWSEKGSLRTKVYC